MKRKIIIRYDNLTSTGGRYCNVSGDQKGFVEEYAQHFHEVDVRGGYIVFYESRNMEVDHKGRLKAIYPLDEYQVIVDPH
jgi:hypothetical protein